MLSCSRHLRDQAPSLSSTVPGPARSSQCMEEEVAQGEFPGGVACLPTVCAHGAIGLPGHPPASLITVNVSIIGFRVDLDTGTEVWSLSPWCIDFSEMKALTSLSSYSGKTLRRTRKALLDPHFCSKLPKLRQILSRFTLKSRVNLSKCKLPRDLHTSRSLN